MNKIIELETEHLKLRQWRVEDVSLYATLTSSKEVMRFFPSTLTREQSDKAAHKFKKLIATRGWGFWAVEDKKRGKFIGYSGLHAPATKFSFSPCVEIAWRVEEKYWKNAYVEEAGKEILRCAFEELNLEEIVYFTSLLNTSSIELMQKLGMKNMQKNFKHPNMPKGHSLEEHRLYKITQKEWMDLNKQ